jgi:hypothetical protein
MIKLIEDQLIDNQLINLFINDWLRIVNDANRDKNCPNFMLNKVKEWMFLRGILGEKVTHTVTLKKRPFLMPQR